VWSQIEAEAPSSPAHPPQGRARHAACTDGERLFIVGGMRDGTALGDICVFSTGPLVVTAAAAAAMFVSEQVRVQANSDAV